MKYTASLFSILVENSRSVWCAAYMTPMSAAAMRHMVNRNANWNPASQLFA